MLYTLRGEVDSDGTLGKCPLWQAFYSSAPGYLTDIWDNWVLLQYTDGKLGPKPYSFEGVGLVDRDVFNGTIEQANEFWKKNSLK